MKIRQLKVVNLFTFENADCTFENYNVMVGHNGSGKTNLVRLLNFIAGLRFPEQGENPEGFNYMELPTSLKLVPSFPSSILIELNLSKEEGEMLFRMITKTASGQTNEAFRNIVLGLHWSPSPNESSSPDFVLLRLGNGFSVLEGSMGWGVCHIPNKANNIDDYIAYIRGLKNVEKSLGKVYSATLGFPPSTILEQKIFQEELATGDPSRFFDASGSKLFIHLSQLTIEYQQGTPLTHIAEVFDFCMIDRRTNNRLALMLFLRCFIRNNLVVTTEITTSHDELALKLLDLEKTVASTWKFDQVVEKFSELFGKVTFRVLKERLRAGSTVDDHYFVQIKEEGQRPFKLDQSASGYHEALSLFSEVVSRDESVLVIDEPALHLHPLKIRLLAKIMTDLANRQVILISHSPYFVSARLFEAGNSLLYVKRDEKGKSKILSKPPGFVLRLKKHVLNTEVFFARVSLLVEGQGDEASFMAISDSLGNILERSDVLVIYMGGKGNTEKYLEILQAYELSYVIMVDSDYSGSQTPDVKKLSGDLEDQFRRLGWRGTKMQPDEAYDFMLAKVASDRSAVQSTEVAQVFNFALTKASVDTTKLWN